MPYVLFRFLTQRQHRLMDRRKNAEELLKWKQLLDAEESTVLNLEKKALKVWDKKEKDKSAVKSVPSKKEETEPKMSSRNGTTKGNNTDILDLSLRKLWVSDWAGLGLNWFVNLQKQASCFDIFATSKISSFQLVSVTA